MKKKRCPVQCRGIGRKQPKIKEHAKELTKPAFCMYFYEQCNECGAPKNDWFTYKILCRCPMKKKCSG